MIIRLKIAATALLFCAPVIRALADTPPLVVSAVLACEEPFQVDVTFDEFVDVDSALDPFNYTMFASASNGAPRLTGDSVTELANGTSFRVLLERGAFVPDAQSVLLVENVTDLAGNPIFPMFSAVVPCPKPWLSVTPLGRESIEIAWATNYRGFSLEFATSLPSTAWERITNSIAIERDRFAVTIDNTAVQRWFRLRKP